MPKEYLLEHPNPHGPHYYTTRRQKCVAIVMHCTAGLEDLDLIGVDASAEQTAKYAATTTRKVSWHSGSDSDSALQLLPASYTAWHVRNYNSATYGHEISKRDMTWGDEPAGWVTATLRRAADHLGPVAESLGIPIRRITKVQLDRAIATQRPDLGGFIGHDVLDPTRRTDPGDFPWERFFDMATGSEVEMAIKLNDRGRAVRAVKKAYNDWHEAINREVGRPVDATDDYYGPAMAELIAEFQAWSQLPEATGEVDGLTAAALFRWEDRGSGGVTEARVAELIGGHSHKATLRLG